MGLVIDSSKQIIHTFNVVHIGWEMDNEAVVTRSRDGTVQIETTSHGSPCTMSKDSLDEHIKETSEILTGLRKASLYLLHNK